MIAGALLALTFLIQTFTSQSVGWHVTHRIDKRADISDCRDKLEARNSALIDDIVAKAIGRKPAADYDDDLKQLRDVSNKLSHLERYCR